MLERLNEEIGSLQQSLGIKLDVKGNVKISFDTKEKKNESNSFNWENFCQTKDIGIYIIGNESSYDAKFTLNVST